MAATNLAPEYTVYVVSGSNKYNLTPAVTGLDIYESEKQIAKSVTIQLANVLVDGMHLSSLVQPRDRVYIYANDGTMKEEVFRGFAWSRPYYSAVEDRTLKLKCYDHLIYLQESETSEYIAAGKTTKDIFTKICGTWGVNLNYTYSSITHAKLVLRGTLADIMTSDILDAVKDRVGTDYTIISDKDTMHVRAVGQNKTIYRIEAGNNAVSTSSEWTMDGMVTKVVILGKADDDDRLPVEATASGNTSKYGTLQKIIDRDENTTLADAKKEAQNILNKDGSPKWEYEVKAPDIPWIRKGDKVYINAGDIVNKYLVVKEISRRISNDKMEMTLSLKSA